MTLEHVHNDILKSIDEPSVHLIIVAPVNQITPNNH